MGAAPQSSHTRQRSRFVHPSGPAGGQQSIRDPRTVRQTGIGVSDRHRDQRVLLGQIGQQRLGLRTFEAVIAAFVDTIAPGGFLVCFIDDAGASAVTERARAGGRLTVVGVGRDERSDLQMRGLAA